VSASRWIELAGADNVRDLGGLPTSDGHAVQPHRLLRSDSLQDLTDSDVRLLVDEYDVRAIADLRTGVEVTNEGPGLMTREPRVEVRHFSLFPEAGLNTDALAADDSDGPIVLPWQTRERPESDDDRRRGATGVYLGYLEDRGDSVVEALRLIAYTDGATIVHCAAGKDRTGVVVAFVLAEVGVEPAAIIEDYALSAERVARVLTRLAARRTYAADVIISDRDYDRHKPRPATMQRLFAVMDEVYGGVSAWLRKHGWTDEDAAALRKRLLD
jgi:protein tyrosine/serine phosphatase